MTTWTFASIAGTGATSSAGDALVQQDFSKASRLPTANGHLGSAQRENAAFEKKDSEVPLRAQTLATPPQMLPSRKVTGPKPLSEAGRVKKVARQRERRGEYKLIQGASELVKEVGLFDPAAQQVRTCAHVLCVCATLVPSCACT